MTRGHVVMSSSVGAERGCLVIVVERGRPGVEDAVGSCGDQKGP